MNEGQNIILKMKKRGLQPSEATYTSLFNACSATPWSHDGLKRLKNLRMLLLDRGYTLNQRNYHALIKAYGRCSDLESAFNIVDEMIENNILVTDETFNFLLQSCITDTEAGFRHALLVWNKMLKKGIVPDLFSFNLMLRCARDCGLGNLESTTDVIQTLTGSSNECKSLSQSDGSEDKLKNSSVSSFLLATREEFRTTFKTSDSDTIQNRPNLLAERPHLGNIIGLSDIKEPEHRLLLLGGCEGILQHMKLRRVKPDIKTFSQLLETIPSTLSAEQSLLKSFSSYKIQPDVDFFNLLIKKRSMRFEYNSARSVLTLMQEHRLTPDIVTFGVLSLSCTTLAEAKQLRSDMDVIGYRLNIQILGALLRNGSVAWDCGYIMYVMQALLEEDVTPSPEFMNFLNKFFSSVRKFRTMKENSDFPKNLSDKNTMYVEKVKDEKFLKSFDKYCGFYKWWCTKVIPQKKPLHPYEQFKVKHNDEEDIALMNSTRDDLRRNINA